MPTLYLAADSFYVRGVQGAPWAPLLYLADMDPLILRVKGLDDTWEIDSVV